MMYTIIHNDTYAFYSDDGTVDPEMTIYNKAQAEKIMIDNDLIFDWCMVSLERGSHHIVQTDIGALVVYYTSDCQELDGDNVPERRLEWFTIIQDVRDEMDKPVTIGQWNFAENEFRKVHHD